MRADRLLALLRLLQHSQPITAAEIGRELELSERSVYRALAALADAGVPISGERGLGGGYRLVERSAERSWDCEPLGLVLKSGAWFLAGRPHGGRDALTFRVSRMSAVAVSLDRFEAVDDFDLASFWETQSKAYQATFPSLLVTVRLPNSLHWRVRGQQVGEASATPDDRIVVVLNLEGADDAVSYLLALRSAVEVLGPPSVREAIAAESARLSALYAGAE